MCLRCTDRRGEASLRRQRPSYRSQRREARRSRRSSRSLGPSLPGGARRAGSFRQTLPHERVAGNPHRHDPERECRAGGPGSQPGNRRAPEWRKRLHQYTRDRAECPGWRNDYLQRVKYPDRQHPWERVWVRYRLPPVEFRARFLAAGNGRKEWWPESGPHRRRRPVQATPSGGIVSNGCGNS